MLRHSFSAHVCRFQSNPLTGRFSVRQILAIGLCVAVPLSGTLSLQAAENSPTSSQQPGAGPADVNRAEFPAPFNTEAEGQHPPGAEEMLGHIQLPPGFQATLFAAEPAVQQPICMDFDDRGRLWVAENYSYSGGPYETRLRDRIVILEDTDNDGRHDQRQVFWDQGFMLTSLTWGFGGLWILHDGTLSFIPDRNGDSVPDSDPVVMLDGWSKDCGHNFVSGLMWGPDGWLYGRHGIVDTSYPGTPGTPREDRIAMNCGIWRFHPTRHVVEVVCQGTTNPWGLDYNRDGQFFMTNNVQGHLWHVIPGAHFQRMYGQDFNPHAYELMDMTADHYHWDTKTKWNESRDGVANDLGGGHSHVGGLIYHGQNFPEPYRDQIFMCNTHGRRINVNRLERHGSGYVGRREPDFMLVNNPWFRGVDLKMGPDGSMFVADWSDNGECHDHDGIHRTSGRIYRISYGTPQLNNEQAAVLRSSSRLAWLNTNWLHSPDWFGRHARRIRQELVAEGELSGRSLASAVSCSTPLRLLYTEAFGGNGRSQLEDALSSQDPYVVAQAIQLAGSTPARRAAHRAALLETAGAPQPAPVLLSLVSVLQKLELAERAELAVTLLKCHENGATIAAENQLTLMTWYGIEPVVPHRDMLPLLMNNRKLLQFAVRRCAYEITSDPSAVARTLQFIQHTATADGIAAERAELTNAMLTAFHSGLAGRARLDAPPEWTGVERELRATRNAEIIRSVDALSVLFGSGAAMEDLRALAGDATAVAVAREQAIAALAQAEDSAAVPLLWNLTSDRAVADAAIRALAQFDDPHTPRHLLNRFGGLKDGNRALAIDTLSTREPYALELIQAIQDGRVNAQELSASQVRQLLALNNPHIRQVLEEQWGVVQDSPEARSSAMEKWKQQLTADTLAAASLQSGAELFRKSCATCHKLYGEGQTIAPDLTGSNRGNLEYLLMNIIDPSAIVPRQFTTSVVVLDSGRVITGVIVSRTDQVVTIQTEKEQLTVALDQIEEIKATSRSLMPDGLFDNLSAEQVRDLMAFLMQRQ